ncbi:MAG: ribosomal protein L7/L12 [Candidatus Blackburnbacteria bacterium]|nr:ribosomal protein L7/L12 [Candidatus Blackburnbacteria bacterium]
MTDKKLSTKLEKIVSEVEGLTVLELSDLVNALQERLGVSAMPIATAPGAGATAQVETAPAEGGVQAGGAAHQTVVMTNSGTNKIAVIKALREINPQLGLKEAKDMTEKLPVEVIKDAKAEEAKTAAEKLQGAGATVELK